MSILLLVVGFVGGAVSAILFPYVTSNATKLADKIKAWRAGS
jgi:hypothetical protein